MTQDRSPAPRRRILIIDDDSCIHDDFRKVFTTESERSSSFAEAEAAMFGTSEAQARPFSFELDYVFRGEEGAALTAKAKEENRPFSLAFVDMRMPGWDGLETTRNLWKQDADLQIVLCTAHTDYSLDELAKGLGYSDRFVILKKPFDPLEVLQLARSLTEKWRLFRAAQARVTDLERTVVKVEEQYRQSQRMEALGQVAGGVVHDFNNMLLVINGYCDMLLNSETASPEQIELLKEIYVAGEHAAKLVSQLLIFSRTQPLTVRPVDLTEVVLDLTKLVRSLIGENIQLRVDNSGDLPKALADTGMIEQVLLNLAINARDAMPKGGRLTVAIEGFAIDEAYLVRHPDARVGDFICLTVEDTGCGMSPEIMCRIFEPFFTTKAIGKGTGLGLATVFGIVKQHEGWIEVKSELGAGTTFRVYLPVAVSSDEESIVTPSSTIVAGGREMILLVEDEDSVRALAATILQKYGYRVLEAKSAEEAVEVWKRHASRIDLLLTDMVMTGEMTGRELAERLKSEKRLLKVIYTSGYSAEVGGRLFELKEDSAFLQKPYHPRRLAETVRQVLDAREKTPQPTVP